MNPLWDTNEADGVYGLAGGGPYLQPYEGEEEEEEGAYPPDEDYGPIESDVADGYAQEGDVDQEVSPQIIADAERDACLLQGFARLLLSSPESVAERDITLIPENAQNRDVSGAPSIVSEIADHKGGDPTGLANPIERAQAWWTWANNEFRWEEYKAATETQADFELEQLWKDIAGGSGQWDAESGQALRERTEERGVELGSKTTDPPVYNRHVGPILLLTTDELNRILGNDIIDPAQLHKWVALDWTDPDARARLASAEAFDALAWFIDEGVRAWIPEGCADDAKSASFTDTFGVRYYVVPDDDRVAIMAVLTRRTAGYYGDHLYQ